MRDTSLSTSLAGDRGQRQQGRQPLDYRRNNPMTTVVSLVLDMVALVLCLIGLFWFCASFFLAKRSMPTISICDESSTVLQEYLGLTDTHIHKLVAMDLIHSPEQYRDSLITNDATTAATQRRRTRSGCWMDRRVDSLVILVVDALRFDFALYNLPNSVGRRLANAAAFNDDTNNNNKTFGSSSRLLQFVADPPTVTMQRLKALTTGGLPTFADISANMGGASVDEDSWIQQLSGGGVSLLPAGQENWKARGLHAPSRAGFVGDDTWVDLYPNHFIKAYPYPSFNTRDLDTVDNGCLKHIPDLLQSLRRGDDKNIGQQQRQNEQESNNENEDEGLEVMVVHFLGVDHVGHTYGPHNEHMDTKLRQMDDALSKILDTLDGDSASCHATFIFGDHGMTPDGNHGGGTVEETHAALFAHTSPGCRPPQQDEDNTVDYNYANLDSQHQHEHYPLLAQDNTKEGDLYTTTFSSIHQIDLVPTISMLLGLPIPYANLGSLVPSLLPASTKASASRAAADIATALALNAAQVWRYFSVYSATANRLPLADIQNQLQVAVDLLKQALEAEDQHNNDATDDLYHQAALMFKIFLTDALALGQRVWTRFDGFGMALGVALLVIGLLAFVSHPALSQKRSATKRTYWGEGAMLPPCQYWEVGTALLFMIFQCGVLTFSNSYILEEENVNMYFLAVLSLMVAVRISSTTNSAATPSLHNSKSNGLSYGLVLIPMASRMSELFVSGHGLDPSLPVHVAHYSPVFLASLAVLGMLRWYLHQRGITMSRTHAIIDCLSIVGLAASWWEKHLVDPERNGYWPCRMVLVLFFVGTPLSIVQAATRDGAQPIHSKPFNTNAPNGSHKKNDDNQADACHHSGKMYKRQVESDMLTVLAKTLIAIITVTGPSTGTSAVLYIAQCSVLYHLSSSSSSRTSSSPCVTETGRGDCTREPLPTSLRCSAVVLASLLRLVTRHAFFATNHGCAFNRLQYSAAFIATKEFFFVTGGISLFLNTFGWEMMGLALAWLLSQRHQASSSTTKLSAMSIWRIYTAFQLVEAVTSCISVSVLRRHLMVWDIYAPHFLFVVIYTILHGFGQVTVLLLSFTDRI